MARYAVSAQDTFYNLNVIQNIEIFFSQPNWDYRMDTAKYGSDSYTIADSVRINGSTYLTPGVKYKGNSSYDSTYIKNPLHIELNTVVSQNYQGYKDIKLSNGYADPSLIREVLAYSILGNYMDCPRSNFATVYINGEYYGLYSNDESINKKFVNAHFGSNDNTFIKCNPIVTPGPTTKSNLRYLSADSSAYFNYYEIKSNYGWKNLVKLCDTITNYTDAIEKVIDVDRVLWMLAFNNVLVNLDSYSGAFCQNYYLYRDATKRYNPIVWDLNMSFGGFALLGSGNNSLAALSLTNMQQMPLNIHANDAYWPLIKNLMSNAMYKRMYHAHVKTILNEFFSNNQYETTAVQMMQLVEQAVLQDNHKFYSNEQFQNAMTDNILQSGYTIPGIKTLMQARVSYLQSTPELQATQPEIASILNQYISTQTASITANVSNATNVYIGYRFNTSQAFTRIAMFDDGQHNDGAAGDGIYGAIITLLSDYMQYYVYAENENAGIFSPQRAEHEFYQFDATSSVTEVFPKTKYTIYPLPAANSVTINSSDYSLLNQILVFDLTGRSIIVKHIAAHSYILDTTNLQEGLYLVSVNGNTPIKLFIVR